MPLAMISSKIGHEAVARVLIIRHETAARRTAQTLAQNNVAHEMLPLSKVIATNNPLPIETADAIIFTSSVAVHAWSKHPEKSLQRFVKSEIFCVGEKTAHMAKNAGFLIDANIAADAQSVALQAIARADIQTFLYPCAVDRSFDMRLTLQAKGKTCTNWEIYKNQLVTPHKNTMENALRDCDTILLYSARTAEHLFKIVGDYGLERAINDTRFIAISPNVAGVVPSIHSPNIHIADGKNEASMLKCLQIL